MSDFKSEVMVVVVVMFVVTSLLVLNCCNKHSRKTLKHYVDEQNKGKVEEQGEREGGRKSLLLLC